MKVNKWTLGLAGLGLVSLPAGSLADEATKMNQVWTALSSTTISGYVDTSIHWNPGTGNANPPAYIYNTPNKQDGFNLNRVALRIAKPLDEAQWAAGYNVDMWFGPDANTFGTVTGTAGDFALKQAYVTLRTPVGNGLDFKIGVFDSVVGYESHDSVNNPNYTASYGRTIEPHTHTGVLMTYQFSELVSANAGIANTFGPMINQRPTSAVPDSGRAESYKTYMGSLALTAPESWGFLNGSTLYAGVVNGWNSGSANIGNNGGSFTDTHLYVGATLNTPVTGLKLGATYDYALVPEGDAGDLDGGGYAWNAALYASLQATEKMSLHARAEYLARSPYGQLNAGTPAVPAGSSFHTGALPSKAFELTFTLQYDLWKNVLSRLEVRWDHAADGDEHFGQNSDGGPNKLNDYLVAANIIYKF